MGKSKFESTFIVATEDGDPVGGDFHRLDAALEEAMDFVAGGAGVDVLVYQCVRRVKNQIVVEGGE